MNGNLPDKVSVDVVRVKNVERHVDGFQDVALEKVKREEVSLMKRTLKCKKEKSNKSDRQKQRQRQRQRQRWRWRCLAKIDKRFFVSYIGRRRKPASRAARGRRVAAARAP